MKLNRKLLLAFASGAFALTSMLLIAPVGSLVAIYEGTFRWMASGCQKYAVNDVTDLDYSVARADTSAVTLFCFGAVTLLIYVGLRYIGRFYESPPRVLQHKGLPFFRLFLVTTAILSLLASGLYMLGRNMDGIVSYDEYVSHL